ncbi:MAG: copper amine oxidase N-terminal domain-containing protein [Bacillota bacterium]|uniref:Copper amine oxidase N-terminal domain-containing protein n=1 Tax=Thermanaerosceptrum fracticalcis TaxID=1712410 RepID=A0A7G6E5D8_THEFR|nr:copper amine oxidase N-terminal domain-containing protein [Thermanaerosceptrum fracticalcis]QNB47292.1 copper amine oxidase N-terminal domain-containing protein [Thermanaerosceptrum fracticalcis]
MKKLSTSLMIAVLSLGLMTTSALAKGKPEWAGPKEKSKAAVTTTTTATTTMTTSSSEEDSTGTPAVPTEPTRNETKNKGKAKKLEERIKVRGMNLKFDVPPVIKEGRTLIPVRAIMNGLGAKVEWNGEAKTVIIIRGDKVIVLNLGTGETTVNGQIISLDVPAQTLNNRTFVPLRFIAQTLGEPVNYDENTGDISIGDGTTTPAEGTNTETEETTPTGMNNQTDNGTPAEGTTTPTDSTNTTGDGNNTTTTGEAGTTTDNTSTGQTEEGTAP